MFYTVASNVFTNKMCERLNVEGINFLLRSDACVDVFSWCSQTSDRGLGQEGDPIPWLRGQT